MTRDKKRSEGEGWILVGLCPKCGRDSRECSCRTASDESIPPAKQRPKFRLEKRRGKPVTIITHLVLSDRDRRELAGQLKKRLGSGGTVSDGEIELQGDHREALTGILRELGFKI